VLRDFGTRSRRTDPVVHFYETFLAAYDPRLRESRGVYYTPEPVVSYIVRSVDEILSARFGCSEGFADTRTAVRRDGSEGPSVLVLDPAAGTGTFLYAIVDHIRERFIASHNAGLWSSYVHEHLLPRIFGFELLMAPYAVAHLKLGLQLAGGDLPAEERADYAYDFGGDERLGVFLTNALDEAVHRDDLLLGRFISDEANAAAKVKRELPIMVVLGNPPYSGHSANRGAWIREKVAEYREGVPGLDRPGQGKWLQDDYVKFLRFGQWRIEQSGAGVLAFITNHAYLDNPTFRGMRRSLMRTFGELYLLDLHGNANRRESAPGGGRDDNVFDIRQGVAIALFVRRPDHDGPARVFRADLFGSREEKYAWLEEHERATTSWEEIRPDAPLYLFAREDEAARAEFYAGHSVADVFNQTGAPAPGIVTTHDQFAVSFSREEAIAKVERLLATDTEAEAREQFRLCSQDQWRYADAKAALADGAWRAKAQEIVYRPFDRRWTIWDRHVAVHRRLRASEHLRHEGNLALVTVGQVAEDRFSHVLLSRLPIDARLTTSNRGIAFAFPLYQHPDRLDEDGDGALQLSVARVVPNLDPAFVRKLADAYGLAWVEAGSGDLEATFGPLDVLHYVYALLSTPRYRRRYRSFLRSDFPHVLLAPTRERFAQLVRCGRELAALHLLEDSSLSATAVSYPVPGRNRVEAGHPRHLPAGSVDPWDGAVTERGRVYISAGEARAERGQFFDGVSTAVWTFEQGGYRVVEKWLKERRGRMLSGDELVGFSRMVDAIERTEGVTARLEEAVADWVPAPAS
jgi:predicted helicase